MSRGILCDLFDIVPSEIGTFTKQSAIHVLRSDIIIKVLSHEVTCITNLTAGSW